MIEALYLYYSSLRTVAIETGFRVVYLFDDRSSNGIGCHRVYTAQIWLTFALELRKKSFRGPLLCGTRLCERSFLVRRFRRVAVLEA